VVRVAQVHVETVVTAELFELRLGRAGAELVLLLLLLFCGLCGGQLLLSLSVRERMR